MRLIDADALKKTIKNMPNDYYGDLCVGDALKEIDNAPTISAVPVVRCRECRHYAAPVVARDTGLCLWADRDELAGYDGYCSRGARMEDT